MSGFNDHCLAVSKEGRVFGRGSNERGQLGLGEKKRASPRFVEIRSLIGKGVRAAHAGNRHSLFESREGKVLSCGNNSYGQLFLSTGPSKSCVYSPTDTTVASGATFCIAGPAFSMIFIGTSPPPNTPNMRASLDE